MSRLVPEQAHALNELGYSVLPLEPGGKRPILPGWQRTRSTHSLIDQWWSYCPDANLGIHTGFSSVAVCDGDAPEALEWMQANLPKTGMIQHTPRGRHAFYRDDGTHRPRVNLFDIHLDIRAGLSQIVTFPSRCERGSWRLEGLTRPSELPVLPPIAEPVREVRQEARRLMTGPVAWVSDKLFRDHWSVAGCGGDTALFKAACFLVQYARLDDATALALLREWNQTNAIPPWPDHRLAYKVSEARKLM